MNPLLLLALGVALQPGPAAPNGALVRKAVMMPARVGGTPSQEDTASLRGVERALAEALARHGNLHILTQTEIAALLSQEQQSQLLGCEAESCMAEIADALGAEVTVLTQVDVTPGLWSLRCALVDRRSALTLRRAAVKARDLDGLLQSVDVVARQLGSGVLHTLEDPRLAARLAPVTPDSPSCARKPPRRMKTSPPAGPSSSSNATVKAARWHWHRVACGLLPASLQCWAEQPPPWPIPTSPLPRPRPNRTCSPWALVTGMVSP